MSQFVKKYYFLTLVLATIIWFLGLIYTFLGERIYFSILVPLGTLLYYYAVVIKFYKRDKKEAQQRSRKRWDLFYKLSLIETILYYGVQLNIWLIGLVIFFCMPYSNIQTYHRVVQHLDWYEVKKELDGLTELDSLYGNTRE